MTARGTLDRHRGPGRMSDGGSILSLSDVASQVSSDDSEEPLTSSDSGDDDKSFLSNSTSESSDTEADDEDIQQDKKQQQSAVNVPDAFYRTITESERIIRAELQKELNAAEEECVLAQPQLNFTLKVLKEAERLKRNLPRRALEQRVDQYMHSVAGVRETKKAYKHLNVPLSEVYAGLTPLHFDEKQYLRTLQETDYFYVDEENDSEDDGRDPDTEQHILDMFSLNLFHEAVIDAGAPVPAQVPERHAPRPSDALALVDRHWQLEDNWHRYHWQKDALKQTKAERAQLVHQMRQKRIRRQLIPYTPGNDVVLKRAPMSVMKPTSCASAAIAKVQTVKDTN